MRYKYINSLKLQPKNIFLWKNTKKWKRFQRKKDGWKQNPEPKDWPNSGSTDKGIFFLFKDPNLKNSMNEHLIRDKLFYLGK